MVPPIPRSEITGLVLAGGLGRRMGGIDKGLAPFHGRPLVAHALERLAPQVGPLLINANRSPDAYADFGLPVVADRIPDYAGPLAGLEAGLAACTTPWLAWVPCDSPGFPPDLVARLAAWVCAHQAPLAFAGAGDQRHPVFGLMRRDCLDALSAYIHGGGRRMQGWLLDRGGLICPFDPPPDGIDPFANLNTPDELRAHPLP
jgi:molybdenum cofactor guanylyltransferase